MVSLLSSRKFNCRMNLLTPIPKLSPVRVGYLQVHGKPPGRVFFTVRSSLPFSNHKAKFHKELEAAVNVVERACSLCVDVQRSLLSVQGRILEKNDQTLVTIADFGVQALVSLELSKLFPSIPLVAEEDSGFLRSNNLVDSVVDVVSDNTSFGSQSLSQADVLEAIDRGSGAALSFGSDPATYWILDPIDGTKGFVKGCEALYVVGLALVVEGKVVLGVMGCPNWLGDDLYNSSTEVQRIKTRLYSLGIIMVAHVGCGTWAKSLFGKVDVEGKRSASWKRCSVDGCSLAPKARYCIPDSQTWESLPLSSLFSVRTGSDEVGEREVVLLPSCCGSLCKYLMVASGRASVFILRARSQTIIKAWDHAVGVICVHEAGGKVTDWKGSKLDLGADQAERRIIYPSGGVLVTNCNIHDQVLEMIACSSTSV